MELLMLALAIARRLWRNLGPYLVIELVLPGGSLIALALFVYRRSRWTPAALPKLARRSFDVAAGHRIRS